MMNANHTHMTQAEGKNPSMLLEVRDVTKTFYLPGGEMMTAVNQVSFDLRRGQTLGIVGESGSGKSTLARLILRLHEPTSGTIRFDGADVLAADGEALRKLRSRMQIVFQDPYSSLLPHYSAIDNVAEPLRLHKRGNKKQRNDRARELLDLVGINPVMVDRYPHEFSGGQQQRIAIARALALDPDLLICDEPTSSLDVSIQAQILNLLKRLQEQLGLSMLFISHNLAVVEHLATHVAVMYRGRVVEMAPTQSIFTGAAHGYTRRLLSAVLPARSAASEAITYWESAQPGVGSIGSVDGIDPIPGTMLNEVAPGHFVAMD
jgi:peptide/nickel transport system ATP-binding protein